MAWWGKLAKIAAVAGAPFTGGATLAALPAISAIEGMTTKAPTGEFPTGGSDQSMLGSLLSAGGSIAGSLAQGREAGRDKQNAQTMTQDSQRLSGQVAKENALENRAKLELEQGQDSRASQGDAYKKALQSALALNLRDVGVNRPKGVPTIEFTGGLRPSAIGQEGHDAAAALNKQAMMSLMNPQQPTALPGLESFAPSQLEKSGVMDNILGVAGAAGSAYDKYEAGRKADDQTSLIKKLLEASQQQANSGIGQPVPPGVM